MKRIFSFAFLFIFILSFTALAVDDSDMGDWGSTDDSISFSETDSIDVVLSDSEDVLQPISQDQVLVVQSESDETIPEISEESLTHEDDTTIDSIIASFDSGLSDNVEQIDDDAKLVSVNLLQSVAPVTPSSTSGLKAVLLDLIGDYDPVIVEYQYQSSTQGYYSYLREIQPDYVWMISCAVLLVVLYCVFRLGGAIWKR